MGTKRSKASAVILFLSTLLFQGSLLAQNLEPLLIWDFSGSGTSVQDRSGKGNHLQGDLQLAGNRLLVKKEKAPKLKELKTGPRGLGHELSIELLFRTRDDFDMGAILTWEGGFSLRMDEQNITADYYLQGTGKGNFRRFLIPLNGVGLNDPHYLFDGSWHHLAFSFSSKTGEFCLYIDGKTRPSFQKKEKPGAPIAQGKALYPGHARNGANLLEADLDQIAIYRGLMRPGTALKHNAEAKGQKKYSYTQSGRLAGSAVASSSGIEEERNPLEFAPGYPDNINKRPRELLESYPDPRYHPSQPMKRIVPWFGDFKRLAALPDEGLRTIGPEMINIQKELTSRFNYYLFLGTSNDYYRPEYTKDPLKPAYYHLQAAAQMPNVPRCFITLWPQTSPSLAGHPSKGPYILYQDMADSYYLKDHSKPNPKSGKGFSFILSPGKAKYFSFAADFAPIRKDAEAMMTIYKNLTQGLAQGPFPTQVFVDFISENGEIVRSPGIAKMKKDKTVQRDKKTNFSQLSWEEYEGKKAYKIRSTYTGSLLGYLTKFNARQGKSAPELQWYNVGGEMGYDYAQSRKINSKSDGYHRATPYFYPQYPGRWRYHYGALNGMDRLISGRSKEIAAGDKLFNPFISPGFDDGSYKAKDRDQIRPGQYLALLKHLAALGADTYTNFMYNNPGSDNQLAEWRIWKTVTPAYAQAVSSRFADFLYNGEVLEGDTERTGRGKKGAKYCFNTGNLLDLVMVRKHRDGKRYLIVGSCQPSGSHASNGRFRKTVSINLEGEKISFEIRKQGSVYVYDKRASVPVFYQLDAWHDWKDPGRWCGDFSFEAENMDNPKVSASLVKTEQSAAVKNEDFSQFSSYISLNAQSGKAIYRFTPIKNEQKSLHLWLKVRGKGNLKVGTTNLKFQLNLNKNSWTWIKAGSLNGLRKKLSQSVELSCSSGRVEVDRLLLRSNSDNLANRNLIATFTQSGNKSKGSSISFQATQPQQGACVDYLWDFGDGYKAFSAKTAHRYEYPGTYKVKLRVEENCTGLSTEKELQLLIR